jgi:drug/metabolite transporter (DMT)-like permease
MPVALMHALAHISAVISLGAGAVSFTHIVKAAEPAFTSLFSALFLKQFFPLPVYLALVPVMGGVAVASLTERKFRCATALSSDVPFLILLYLRTRDVCADIQLAGLQQRYGG